VFVDHGGFDFIKGGINGRCQGSLNQASAYDSSHGCLFEVWSERVWLDAKKQTATTSLLLHALLLQPVSLNWVSGIMNKRSLKKIGAMSIEIMKKRTC
jgi:hypothetical protein